jgi:hypothetical protein
MKGQVLWRASVPLSITSPYSYLVYRLFITIGFRHNAGAPRNSTKGMLFWPSSPGWSDTLQGEGTKPEAYKCNTGTRLFSYPGIALQIKVRINWDFFGNERAVCFGSLPSRFPLQVRTRTSFTGFSLQSGLSTKGELKLVRKCFPDL